VVVRGLRRQRGDFTRLVPLDVLDADGAQVAILEVPHEVEPDDLLRGAVVTRRYSSNAGDRVRHSDYPKYVPSSVQSEQRQH